MQRQSAQILAATAVALQAARAMQLDAKADDYNYNWSQLGMNFDWPADNCCRVYRNMQFRSRPQDEWPTDNSGNYTEYDWADLCPDNDVDEKVIDLSKAEFAEYSDLNDQIQSYKCGRNTAIKFCRDAGESRCDEWMYGESGAGGSESQDLGLHDVHTTIRLTPYNPRQRHAATVYAQDVCHGHQSVVWIDEGEVTSGEAYTNIHESLVTTPDLWGIDPGVHSVLLPQGLGYWMEVYDHAGFGGAMKRVDGSADDWTRCKNFYTGWRSYKNNRVSSLIFGWDPVLAVDDTPAGAGCCRLYQEAGYKETEVGAGFVVEEKCLSWSGGAETHDLDGLTGVGSWRCADDISATFLKSSVNKGTGIGYNSNAGLGDGDFQVTIDKVPTTLAAATLYSGAGCAGSFDVVDNLGGDGTGLYEDVVNETALTEALKIYSVFIPAGSGTTVGFLPQSGGYDDLEWIASDEEQECFDLNNTKGAVDKVVIEAGSQ